jgi:hypothetical protein
MDWMAKSDKNVTNPLVTFRKEVKKPIDCFRIKSNQKEANIKTFNEINPASGSCRMPHAEPLQKLVL